MAQEISSNSTSTEINKAFDAFAKEAAREMRKIQANKAAEAAQIQRKKAIDAFTASMATALADLHSELYFIENPEK